MKLEVGMYVRTKKGLIAKYIGFEDFTYNFDSEIYWFYEYYNDYIYEEDFEEWFEKRVVKTSHNIIDLIEIGDIVVSLNGANILEYNLTTLSNIDELKDLWNIQRNIKSIVTKEQFECMSYKVG